VLAAEGPTHGETPPETEFWVTRVGR
jgi:hypothetical protein